MPREHKNGLGASCHKFVYDSDEFRMFYHKVIPCSKHYVHEWTECPFAHPNEKAARRCPRTYFYTGITCPDMNGKLGGKCPRGKDCLFAHNLFEFWLHPSRYRTQMCSFGPNCRRSVCFFAHTPAEIRKPDSASASGAGPRASTPPGLETDTPSEDVEDVSSLMPKPSMALALPRASSQEQLSTSAWPSTASRHTSPTHPVQMDIPKAAHTTDSPETMSILLAALQLAESSSAGTIAATMQHPATTASSLPQDVLQPPPVTSLVDWSHEKLLSTLMSLPAYDPAGHLVPSLPCQFGAMPRPIALASQMAAVLPQTLPQQFAGAVLPMSMPAQLAAVNQLPATLCAGFPPPEQKTLLQALLTMMPPAFATGAGHVSTFSGYLPATTSEPLDIHTSAPMLPAVLQYNLAAGHDMFLDNNAVLNSGIGRPNHGFGLPMPLWPVCYSR